MSKRALWLAVSALCLGLVATSCTSVDGETDFSDTAGRHAGGGGSSSGGTKGNGGTKAGAGTNAGGGTDARGGEATSAGGTKQQGGTGGSEQLGGQPGGAGEPGTSGGMPGEGGTGASGDGGAGGEPAGAPCENFTSCKEGELCVKPGCGEDELGVCVLPARASDPVCGCDGVTYISGKLANMVEVDVRGAGVCSPEVGVGCEEAECPKGLTCGRVELSGGDCETKVGGVCWQLPAACPKELAEYGICGTKKCATLCDAVSSGEHAVPGGLSCAVALP
jgi:hypothetical protein